MTAPDARLFGMAHVSDAVFYNKWLELLSWLQQYATSHALRFDKESDFTNYIYRMERNFELPTTVQAVSLGLPDGTPVVIASVSPLHEPIKGMHLRLQGAHQAWHLHVGDAGLLEGKRVFTQERLNGILDAVFAVKQKSA